MRRNLALLQALANADGGSPIPPGLSFWAPLGDLGSGVADLTLAKGTGSATFTRATTARTVLGNGLIATVGSNTPRSYYSPSGLYQGCLLEPNASNICLNSEDLTNASWIKGASTINANSFVGPDGATTADKIQEDNTSAVHFVTQAIAKAASAITYTHTVYLRQGERNFAFLQMDDGSGNGALVFFNLTTGAVSTAATGVGTPFTSISATAAYQAFNGFWRCNLTATSNVATVITFAYGPVIVSGTQSYLGTTGSGIYAWGSQIEASSTPTSYIPTAGATGTRTAESLTYPSAGNLIAASGTIAAEATFLEGSSQNHSIFAVSDATLNNRVTIFNTQPGAVSSNAYRVTSAGVAQLSNTGTSTPAINALHKYALRWSTVDATAYMDGTLDRQLVAALSSPAALTTIYAGVSEAGAGTQQPIACLKNLRGWQRAITDAEEIALTR